MYQCRSIITICCNYSIHRLVLIDVTEFSARYEFGLYVIYDNIRGDRGSTVVKVLCYKSEGRWFDPSWKSFRSHYGPGVDSASNKNEYQEHFLGVKAADAQG